ncbi:lipocalin family protein [Paucibacter sp. PLA-PC-4]|uniref:lipocalin family protein n=1 Tax=Paucibacter sp. PLA-PC-4 TaxID=2993655 RepID=UPI0022494AF3|nr:lipocalin family protein [Paucibacter sp. PLA-PC-4]MCX2860243.1 lipocalin family protein [Paucibacter sp. PLA-PC-4]
MLKPLLIAAALLTCNAANAADAPLPTVASVDLARYAGAWYEIALLPNRFQRQCVADTQARYRPDGDRVEVINRCRAASGDIEDVKGHAKVVDGSGNARLRVTFFWPFYGDYWVLDLDENYRQVLVGTPNRKYAWVLSREPQMDEAQLQRLLDKAASLGFDKSAFQRTPQTRPLER